MATDKTFLLHTQKPRFIAEIEYIKGHERIFEPVMIDNDINKLDLVIKRALDWLIVYNNSKTSKNE